MFLSRNIRPTDSYEACQSISNALALLHLEMTSLYSGAYILQHEFFEVTFFNKLEI